jgi:hypothetical protein
MSIAATARLRSLAISLPFRLAFALALVAFHLAMMAHLGKDRLGYRFNEAPDNAPAFRDPSRDLAPDRWDRLVVSRWDAQHYMALGMRGYRFCKDRSQLRPGAHPDDGGPCQLHFYPTYGFLGAAVVAVTHLPIDYALFGLSMAACIAIALMWTGKEVTRPLGVGNAYLSLLLLNLFSTGFVLVTIETEPCLIALSLGTFVCFQKRWLAVAALLAGLATAIRITGVATGFAFCAALLVATLRDHPRPGVAWIKSALLMALSGWGIVALMTYYGFRFGDPLIYAHSHEQAFQHSVGLWKTLFPDGRVLIQSIWAEPNDGIFLAAALLWFALGHREGLSRFSLEGQVFWYTLYFAIVGISMVGSVDYAFGGSCRFMLTVLPLFFAMAAIMRKKPVVLALWLFMSTAHYYNGSLCFYESQRHPDRLHRCGFARFFRSEELQNGGK